MNIVLGALLILVMRILDVSIGTIRTIMVVQGRKLLSGVLGFFEVTIWVLAASQVIVNVRDNWLFVLGYSSGFGLGNVIGIWLEQKFGFGFVTLNVISVDYADKISIELRKNNFGVTALPGEGGQGNVSLLMISTTRKRKNEAIKIIEQIDPKSFITVQSITPYRGYVSPRK